MAGHLMSQHGSLPKAGRVSRISQRGAVLWMAACLVASSGSGCAAETLKAAILRTFDGNPALNAQRANLRATREKLPQARAGFFPKVSAVADIGYDKESGRYANFGNFTRRQYQSTPKGYGLQITQNLFDGWRTANSVSQSGHLIDGTSEALRAQEQQTIVNTASAYLNVLRDSELQDVYRDNAMFIGEQTRIVSERHAFGDVTRTDLALAQARHAIAKSQQLAAVAGLAGSKAIYRQTTGAEAAGLVSAAPVDSMAAMSLEQALQLAHRQHPGIKAARSAADAAQFQVKITDGELSPKFGVTASIGRRFDVQSRGDMQFSGSVVGQLSIPLFDGGAVASRSRETREVAGQRQLEADAIEDQVRSAVLAGWSQLQTGRAQVASAQAQVAAARDARAGMSEEYRFGQRTTLDILNAQQDLLYARVNLATALHDRVLASFILAQAIGALTLPAVVAALDASKPLGFDRNSVPQKLILKRTIDAAAARSGAAGPCGAGCSEEIASWKLRLLRLQ